MIDSCARMPDTQLRPVRGQRFLRFLHRCLPLGRHYHPLFSLLNSRHGFVTVPFGRFKLVHPASWRKEVTKILLLGADVVPEFSLLVPVVRQLDKGYLLDVGANIGIYTLLLRSESPLPIIAYEPQPFLSKLLCWTVSLNDLSDVQVKAIACGATKGRVPFHTGINGAIAVGVDAPAPDTSSSNSGPDKTREQEAEITQTVRPVVEVPITTLDDDLADVDKITLIKIDCEGYEVDVLKGAQRLIERHRPCLFIEIHPGQLERYGFSVGHVLEQLPTFYESEFWWFNWSGPGSKLQQSIAKFRKPRCHRYQTRDEMLAAAESNRRPAQIYCLARPKPPGTKKFTQ